MFLLDFSSLFLARDLFSLIAIVGSLFFRCLQGQIKIVGGYMATQTLLGHLISNNSPHSLVGFLY